ncbi:MAG: penicillin-binding protein 1C [Candidatus Binatia bacterium]
MRLRWAAGALAAAAAISAAVALTAGLALPDPPDERRAPSFAEVRASTCPSDARLVDRHGALLHELRVDRTRRRLAWTPIGAISPALLDALIASEDGRFFRHGGVDALAIASALGQRLRGGAPRGASTITMQLAAMLDPALARRGGPRSLAGKWAQMRAAWALEERWRKREIAEAYVNLVTFRGELQGIGAAAELLFDKAPHGLTSAEAVALAALVRSPNAERDALIRRAAALNHRLGETAAPGALALAVDRIIDAPVHTAARAALAPHVARRLLADGGGPCADVRSTLDAGAQRAALEAVERHLFALRDRGVRDAAVLVVENATGAVRAYVGSSGALSSAAQVDGVRAPRQAGSTLKPFLYALALDRRLLTAASALDDAPLEIAVSGGLFRPRNYDDRFHGPVSVRTALAGSLNVPAVRALQLLGADDFAAQLRALGFHGVDRPGGYYGPSLALGSADVTLWQLVGAYRALAAGGLWQPLRLTAEPEMPHPARVIGAEAAFIVADMLADRAGRSITFGLEGPLTTPFWTAVKTGTSKDMRDNWCIGFSSRYTVGVWVGNFSGAPMRDVSGVTGAAPIWLDLMEWLHAEVPSHAPAPPPRVVQAAVGGPGAAQREWFLAGTAPEGPPKRAAAPRILAPAEGTIVALDPDIPAARQRLWFEAESAASYRWRLAGQDLGGAAQPQLWQPRGGQFALELVDASGRVAHAIHFEVRPDSRRTRAGAKAFSELRPAAPSR